MSVEIQAVDLLEWAFFAIEGPPVELLCVADAGLTMVDGDVDGGWRCRWCS